MDRVPAGQMHPVRTKVARPLLRDFTLYGALN